MFGLIVKVNGEEFVSVLLYLLSGQVLVWSGHIRDEERLQGLHGAEEPIDAQQGGGISPPCPPPLQSLHLHTLTVSPTSGSAVTSLYLCWLMNVVLCVPLLCSVLLNETHLRFPVSKWRAQSHCLSINNLIKGHHFFGLTLLLRPRDMHVINIT